MYDLGFDVCIFLAINRRFKMKINDCQFSQLSVEIVRTTYKIYGKGILWIAKMFFHFIRKWWVWMIYIWSIYHLTSNPIQISRYKYYRYRKMRIFTKINCTLVLIIYLRPTFRVVILSPKKRLQWYKYEVN